MGSRKLRSRLVTEILVAIMSFIMIFNANDSNMRIVYAESESGVDNKLNHVFILMAQYIVVGDYIRINNAHSFVVIARNGNDLISVE